MPKDPAKVLKEWIIEYIKNKDIFTKSIKDIKQSNNEIIVEHTNKVHAFIVIPFIEDINPITRKIDASSEFISLVIFNSKDNLNKVIENWEKLSKNPKFSIYFVNPFSSLEKKWIIFPSTHSLISSGSNLKKGLLALFSTVEEVKKN